MSVISTLALLSAKWEHLYSVLYSFILCQWLDFNSWKSMSSVYFVAVIQVLFIAEARRIWLHFLYYFLVFELVIAFFLALSVPPSPSALQAILFLITTILCVWVLFPLRKGSPSPVSSFWTRCYLDVLHTATSVGLCFTAFALWWFC